MPVPEGFQQMDSNSPFIQLIGPIYYRADDTSATFGVLVEEKHCNSSGRVHGGLIATVADIALGNSIGHAGITEEEREAWRSTGKLTIQRKPMVTVSMATDYSGTAQVGDWIEVNVDVQHLGRSMAFANAYFEQGGQRIVRTSGVYRFLT